VLKVFQVKEVFEVVEYNKLYIIFTETFPTFCLCMMPPLQNSALTFVARLQVDVQGLQM
jgi:hypothetical protein